MVRFRFTILFVFMAMVVCGCASYKIKLVEGSDPRAPTFELLWGSDAMPVIHCDAGDARGILHGMESMMWGVSRINTGEGTFLNQITYGEMPKGMALTFRAKPLEKNIKYSIGCTRGEWGAALDFMIIEEDGRLRVIEAR